MRSKQSQVEDFHFDYLRHEWEIHEVLGVSMLGHPRTQPGGHTPRLYVKWFPLELSKPMQRRPPSPKPVEILGKRRHGSFSKNRGNEGPQLEGMLGIEEAVTRKHSRTPVYAGRCREVPAISIPSDLPLLDANTLVFLDELDSFIQSP